MRKYDFIIAGGGCAGLSLVVELLAQPVLQNKKILIIDDAPKAGNDRTWCFWTRNPGQYAGILTKTWEEVHFAGPGGLQRTSAVAPYTYCMIRSGDFYAMAQQRIAAFPNVEFVYGHISRMYEGRDFGEVWVDTASYAAPWIFNSCHSIAELQEQMPPNGQLQHFRGWWVKADNPVFSPQTATLMDFRAPQEYGAHFFYLLPLNTHEALVEYTVFSGELLPREHYDGALAHYLKEIVPIGNYTVQEEEHGIIPMFPIGKPTEKGQRIIATGTPGGAVKPTTGYAFLRIQAQSRLIAGRLAKGKAPILTGSPGRFGFYDGLLLHLLQTRGTEAAGIFDALFQRNPFARILRFLDEDSHLAEEAAIFSTLPWGMFLTALWEKHFFGSRGSIVPSLSWHKNTLP